MLTRDERLTLLRTVPVLAQLAPDRLAILASHCHELYVGPGERLSSAGAPGRQAFVVIEGSATVTAGGGVVAHIGPGSFVGDLAGPPEGAASATITVDTAMQVLVIGPQAIAAAMPCSPA